MLKKEIRDTLRQLLESSLLLISIPFVIVIWTIAGIEVSIEEALKLIPLLTLFVFAAYSGIGIFQTERKDKGFEYLLSLPLSLAKIFLVKVTPRFLAVTVLYLILFGLFPVGDVKMIFYILILIHLTGICFSLVFASNYVKFTAVILVVIFYYYLFLPSFFNFSWVILTEIRPVNIISIAQNLYSILQAVSVLVLLIPIAIPFFLTYRKFDLKPQSHMIKPYLYIGIPFYLAAIVMVYFYYDFDGIWHLIR
ncbi:MAG: hypothetical protein GY940_45295 [bacterium]|nr:hypothetical protein [bacterium]